MIAAIVSTKLRGYSDHIPIPPVVSFIILAVIAFYASSNTNCIDSIKPAVKLHFRGVFCLWEDG